jgi:hypothetical protein
LNFELLLPGSILAIKFAFKVVVDQQLSSTGLMKAFLMFPVDIAFLTFTFGAAAFSFSPPSADPVRAVLIFALATIFVLFVVHICCRRADLFFDKAKMVPAVSLAAAAYLLSISVIVLALLAPGLMA